MEQFAEYWSLGKQTPCLAGSLCTAHKLHHWQTPEGSRQTELFRQMVAVDKNDPSRPRNGDRLQNGARL